MFYHWGAGRKNGSGGGGGGGGDNSSSHVRSVTTSVNMESSDDTNRHLRTHLFFGGGNGGPNDQPPILTNIRRPNDGNPSRGSGQYHNNGPNRCRNVNGKDQKNNFDGGNIVQNNINNASMSMVNNNLNNNRAPFIQISCPTPVEPLPPSTFGTSGTPAGQRSRSSTRSTIKTPSPARSSSSSGAPVAGRQVSRMARSASNAGSTASSSADTALSGSLAGAIQQLHEDCFIIPAHRMNNFLPMSLLDSEKQQVGSLNMMHVDDPKLCIILHFAEPSSPSLNLQLTALRTSLARLKSTSTASEAMILMNIEKRSGLPSYPFIVYLVVNSSVTTPYAFLQTYNSIIVEELSPDKLGVEDLLDFPGLNYISGYEEVATIARPPIDIHPKVPSNQKSGFLITIFKVFPGDDREKLERSWLLWTGARVIYKSLPNCLGMRRITFHKKLCPDGGITYVLMCECTEMMDYVTIACGFVEHLRARCCGYTGIYKNVEKF